MEKSTLTQDAAAQLTTVQSILWHAVDYGQTTRKALAMAADSSEEMVGRVLAGQAPKLLVFRRWVGEASPLPKTLKDMLIEWFCRPTIYAAIGKGPQADFVLDHNGDGLIDARDVLAIQIDAACKGTEAMGALSLAMLDGELTEAEKSQVRSLLAEMAALVAKAGEALEQSGASMRVA